jgi:predicted PurR-regulated permease PerM
MPQPRKPEWQRAVVALSAGVLFALAVGTMYWARSIFIPLALGVFLTFVLSPVVRRLERLGLGRIAAVAGTVGAAVLAVGLTGWLLGTQAGAFARDLPGQKEAVRGKLEAVRKAVVGDGSSELWTMADEFASTLTGTAPSADPAAPPPTVVVTAPGSSWSSRLSVMVNPALELAGQVFFAFVLCVFMLLKREDLRNRLIRLVGAGTITTTTKAVDDASRRISRYLLAQLLINTAFGVVITAAMYAIGVPYAVVWGVVATLMRYVPYLGTWLGLLFPVLATLATADSWWQPFAVVGVYGGLELLCNNVFEPWLYGTSMGLSPVAQLVAAAFWAFVWGPIGLVLSGPLTVCLLVLGKYVPKFEFLDVLLGDDEVLSPDVRFYQRLTAGDDDEATAILAEQLKLVGATREAVADAVVVPALAHSRRDAEDGALSRDDQRALLKVARVVVEDLARPDDGGPKPDRVRLLGLPARDDADLVALEVLGGLLDCGRWEVDIAGSDTLTAEAVARVGETLPAVVCVSALPPGGLTHTRYLCKRLRKQFPTARILVGRWGLSEDVESNREQLTTAGADFVGTSLAEVAQHLCGWLPALADRQGDSPTPAAKPIGRAAVGTRTAVV